MWENEKECFFHSSGYCIQYTHSHLLCSAGVIPFYPHTVVTVSLSPSSYVVYEEDGSVTVQLVKSGETQLPVEVLLSTVDGTASGKQCYYIINIRLYRLK